MAIKQKATVTVRLFPKTHKRLKVKSAKCRISLADVIDLMSLDYDINQTVSEEAKKLQ